MNKSKLLGRMAETGYTQKALAIALGMSANTLCKKINGKQPFNADEALEICDLLGIIDDVEKAQIFLAGSSQIRDNQQGA